METVYPEYLYHYTSIKTLSLILNEKKIRFNRLDRVDDLLEAESADILNLGRLYFVSCWSSSEEENIPLWSLYTPNMAGVRIKFPARMFKTYEINPQSKCLLPVLDVIKECPLPSERLCTKEYIVNPMIWKFSEFLKEVEYTNDENKLHPVISNKVGEQSTYLLGLFGRTKKLEWKFQSEWRYIINFMPGPFDYSDLHMHENVEDFTQRMHSGVIHGSVPFDEFYLDLDDKAVNNIELTLGPKCCKGDRIIVESLLSKFCTNSKLEISNFRIR